MADYLHPMLDNVIKVYRIVIIPALFGVLCMTTVARALIFWQKERTARVFFFFIAFLTLCLLYLVAALKLPTYLIDVGRITFFLSMLLGSIFEWKELIVYQIQKAQKHAAGVEEAELIKVELEHKKLKDLTDEEKPIALIATMPVRKDHDDAT